jgi:hypothetical protein
MNDQVRKASSSKLNNEHAKGLTVDVEAELGEEELSKVSGGRGLYLACVKGRHFPTATITC